MKIKIGKYKNFYGPYQLAETLCFWVRKEKDEYGLPRKPEWVHDFGEWLAHGSVEKDLEVGESRPFIGTSREERHTTWIYKFLLWIDKLRGGQKKVIQIDPWDTWSAHSVIAEIIHPMIVQLKANTHGAPQVADEDVPDHLRKSSAPPTENEWDTDDNHFRRWDWVLDEIAYAFECAKDDEWENKYWTGDGDFWHEKLENGLYEIKHGINHTLTCDFEGMEKERERIQNGLRLFAKYFFNMWD